MTRSPAGHVVEVSLSALTDVERARLAEEAALRRLTVPEFVAAFLKRALGLAMLFESLEE